MSEIKGKEERYSGPRREQSEEVYLLGLSEESEHLRA